MSLLDEARDVLDHDDRIVDNESRGDRQRHQRQVVERVAEQIHHAERADDRERDGDAGNDGCRQPAQEQKNHQNDEEDGQQQLEFDVAHRRADGHRAIGENSDLDTRRQRVRELRQQMLDAVDDIYGVGTGLPLHIHDHRGRDVHPGRFLRVFHAVDDMSDIGDAHRCPVSIRDDHRLVVGAGVDLIVRADAVALLRPLQVAFRLIGVRGRETGAQVFETQSERGKRRRIRLHAHCGFLSAADRDQSDAGKLRDFLRECGIGEIFDFAQRKRCRC